MVASLYKKEQTKNKMNENGIHTQKKTNNNRKKHFLKMFFGGFSNAVLSY